MIRIEPQPEPAAFHAAVREKGRVDPKETDGGWKPHWRHCLDDLHQAYGGVCAYWSINITIGNDATVDHYKPKTIFPDETYEWSNYRLACMAANRAKNNYLDVLDPFAIETGWFRLSTVTWEVAPAAHLPDEIKNQVAATILRVKLNNPQLIRRRRERAQSVKTGQRMLVDLARDEPFLAWALERDGWPRGDASET